jgi:hypothetical protein
MKPLRLSPMQLLKISLCSYKDAMRAAGLNRRGSPPLEIICIKKGMYRLQRSKHILKQGTFNEVRDFIKMLEHQVVGEYLRKFRKAQAKLNS